MEDVFYSFFIRNEFFQQICNVPCIVLTALEIAKISSRNRYLLVSFFLSYSHFVSFCMDMDKTKFYIFLLQAIGQLSDISSNSIYSSTGIAIEYIYFLFCHTLSSCIILRPIPAYPPLIPKLLPFVKLSGLFI